jgi:hypothetical protein
MLAKVFAANAVVQAGGASAAAAALLPSCVSRLYHKNVSVMLSVHVKPVMAHPAVGGSVISLSEAVHVSCQHLGGLSILVGSVWDACRAWVYVTAFGIS